MLCARRQDRVRLRRSTAYTGRGLTESVAPRIAVFAVPDQRGGASGKLADRYGVSGSNVISSTWRSTSQQAEKPNRQIARVKIRSASPPIAMHFDDAAMHRIVDEVARGKMHIEFLIRAERREDASDRNLQAKLLSINRAKRLRRALCFSVGIHAVKAIWRADPLFVNMCVISDG